MAVDGDRLAIGLPMDAVTTLGGVVEIFDRDAGTGAWGRTARVEISGSAVGGILSSGMIGLDGDRVVFGNWNDDNAGPRTGAVWDVGRHRRPSDRPRPGCGKDGRGSCV